MIILDIEPNQYIYGEGPGPGGLWIEATLEGGVFNVRSFHPDTGIKPTEVNLNCSFNEALQHVLSFLGV